MDTESPRLFIGIPIDERWKERLIKHISLLQLKLPFQKWTHAEDYHITLKFLGDTSAVQLQQLQKLLAMISNTTSPFELTEKGWGTFGPDEAPIVLWAGVGGDLTSLHILQQKIDGMLNLEFPKENRDYHPHLTIARRYNGREPLTIPIKEYLPEAREPINWSVDEIKLYQSHLQKRPMYEPIASFKLRK
jgi:2'-5' RNA ligase